MAPHSSPLAWKIPRTEEPGGPQSMGSLRVRQDSATSLSLFTFHFHALEKAMATHSSVLAWRIPGTAEPGGLPSMGSHRVGHNWSDLAAVAAVGFPGGSDGKESACDAGDPGSIPGSGKLPGWREWQPIPVLLLGESMDRGAWQATLHGVQRVRHDWAHTHLSMHTHLS